MVNKLIRKHKKVVGSNPIPKKNLPKYKSYVDSVKTILDVTNTVNKKPNSKYKVKKIVHK